MSTITHTREQIAAILTEYIFTEFSEPIPLDEVAANLGDENPRDAATLIVDALADHLDHGDNMPILSWHYDEEGSIVGATISVRAGDRLAPGAQRAVSIDGYGLIVYDELVPLNPDVENLLDVAETILAALNAGIELRDSLVRR